MIKKIFGGGEAQESGLRSPDAARNDPAVARQLKKTVCKFPCKWEAATLEVRWSWIKSATPDNPAPLTLPRASATPSSPRSGARCWRRWRAR
ncbi:hypothetical protein [Massilia sp. DWR3-1-1]|uniref:hypothetical protein n=1 Tax=Massilia sp. DWR3-1-1 TaxID=2804559 RepID=UPI003CFA19E5